MPDSTSDTKADAFRLEKGLAVTGGSDPGQPHDPGGRRLPLPPDVVAHAVYGGPGDCYRYRLVWKTLGWRPGNANTLAVGLMNPSTAGHDCGDATVAWCWRWSKSIGCTRLIVVNADAYRCTDQRRLAEVEDPCGEENEDHWRRAAVESDMIVLGYGRPKLRALRSHGPRMARIMRRYQPLFAWRVSRDGTPWHPLYLPADTQAIPYVIHD